MFEQLTSVQLILLGSIVIINIFTCVLYYVDKQRAIKNQSRISEKTLFLSAFALGGIGAWIGMTKFRHKTKHLSFKIGVPIAGVVTLFACYYILS